MYVYSFCAIIDWNVVSLCVAQTKQNMLLDNQFMFEAKYIKSEVLKRGGDIYTID